MLLQNNSQRFIDNFIGKYSLSKTLRFELKPVKKTKEWLKKHQIFEKDKVIDQAYQQAKVYFDKLHQEFIKESLMDAQIDWSEYVGLKAKFKSADKSKKEKVRDKLSKEAEKKRKEIVKLFNETAKKWQEEYNGQKYLNKDGKEKKIKLEKKTPEVLSEAGIIGVLKLKFPKEKEGQFIAEKLPSLFVKDKDGNDKYIFDIFERFTTYLSKFQETRKNLYKDDGTSTAVATRIVNENLPIFLDDISRYEKMKAGKVLDFSKLEEELAIKLDNKLDDIFTPGYYNNLLLQEGIDNFNKNIIGELNKFINEARQKEQDKSKRKQMKFFDQLRKQILGQVEKEEQLVKEKDGKSNVAEVLCDFIEQNKERFPLAKKLMGYISSNNDLGELSDDSLRGIYITRAGINTIAHRWFLSDLVSEFLFALPQKTGKDKDTPHPQDYISLFDIKMVLENDLTDYKDIFRDKYSEIIEGKSRWESFLVIWQSEFNKLFEGFETEKKEKIVGYNSALSDLQDLLQKAGEDINRHSKDHTKVIKNYADAALRIFQMMKYFYVRDRSKVDIIDDYFYSNKEFGFGSRYYNDFELVRYYNALRNYFTQKVEGERKIKLNFEKGTLLKGFSKQYSAYLFKKEHNGNDEYYLGILSSKELDEKLPIREVSEYYYFPASQLRFTNIINKKFSSRFGYKYSDEEDDQKAISDAKRFIKERFLDKYPDLGCILERDFRNKSDFKDSIEKVLRKIYAKNKFIKIDKSQVEDKIESGDLFMFRILNKDLKNLSKNTQKDIHTYYFLMLFDEDNLNDPLFKISGASEVFFRPAIKNIDRNKIKTKETKRDITSYLRDKYGIEKYQHNRFLEDKYLLHLSVELNYNGKKDINKKNKRKYNFKFNKDINIHLKNNFDNLYILGIDRGEKHLLYYSLINTKGQIVKQGSWNNINGQDYWEKLTNLEKKRLEERQSWDPITKIKDLKKGYISAVIGEIVKLYKQYDMVIVLEDLNIGFKQSRGKFERNVYQQFEKALIEKLNFLVFKDKNPLENGGVLRAYQLTAPFDTFKKIGKQTGILFYVSSSLTSIMDPATGFVNSIYPKPSETQEKIKEMVNKFIEFRYDDSKKTYYFEYNMKDFGDSGEKKYPDKKWRVYTKVPRIIRDRDSQNYWYYKYISPKEVTDAFVKLFELWGFNDLYGDIKQQIQEKESKGELKGEKDFNPFNEGKSKMSYNFYNSLAYLLRLVLQIRNSSSLRFKKDENGNWEKDDEGYDFIASPVEPFFTSSIKKHNISANLNYLADLYIGNDKDKFIQNFNGDANGAYNIARKGLMMLERIRGNPERPDLYINKVDWVRWAIEKNL